MLECGDIVTFVTYFFENSIFFAMCLTAQRICRNFRSEWGLCALLLIFILVLQALISRIKQKKIKYYKDTTFSYNILQMYVTKQTDLPLLITCNMINDND